MGVTAAILAIGAAGGFGVAAISNSNKSEKAASSAASVADQRSRDLESQIKNQQASENDQTQKNAIRDAAAQKQRAAAAQAGGRSGTILTGPLGTTGSNPNDQQKTLLGA